MGMCIHEFEFFSCCVTYNRSFMRMAGVPPMFLVRTDKPVHGALGTGKHANA